MRPRLGITTTRKRGAELVDQTEALRCRPVLLPCIEVMPAEESELETVRMSTIHSDWLIFTSSRAVEALWPNGKMPDVPAIVVGNATAKAVAGAGGRVVLVGESGLASLTGSWDPADGRVTFPHGSLTDLSGVAELGVSNLFEATVYATRPIAPGPETVDAALFASPSAVRGWLRSRLLSEVEVISAIGTTTAAALEEYGRSPSLVAPNPDLGALIEATAQHMRERSSR